MHAVRALGIGGVAMLIACGSNATLTGPSSSSGSPDTPPADDAGEAIKDDAGATTDSSVPPADGGPNGWDGTFTGPLQCSGPGSYTHNYSGACGTQRWAIKTGTDATAPSISLLPKLTTPTALGQATAPGNLPLSRLKPYEVTAYAIKDARLIFARLEDDGDYHLVLSDKNGATLIGEIPYPGSCTTGSTWQCLLTRARAAVDGQMTLEPLKGKNLNLPVSVAGVGFWDNEHGQYGAAPNGIELHPILAICFGLGCDPSKS